MNFNLELGDSQCPLNTNMMSIIDMVLPSGGRKEVDKNHCANMDLKPEHTLAFDPSWSIIIPLVCHICFFDLYISYCLVCLFCC